MKTEQVFQIYYVMRSFINLLFKNMKIVFCPIILEIRKKLCGILKCKKTVWITIAVV